MQLTVAAPLFYLLLGVTTAVLAEPAKGKPAEKPKAAKKANSPEKPNPIITNPALADADYWLQGEYLGTLASGHLAGLQVVALGEGNFQAVFFEGGLPGYGWSLGDQKWPLAGRGEGGGAVLKSATQQINVAAGVAEVKNAQGTVLGTLSRVERRSNTLGAAPPWGATVLFNGSSAANFVKGAMTDDHLLKPGGVTNFPVGDFRLHLEFRTPYKPAGRGQDRGNSGVYIQTRYEVQILDSFGLEGAFNECGSIYRQRAPLFNMCLPPLVWQTYDLWFTSPRFDAAAKKTQNARLTLWHNGIVVQNDVELTSQTGAGKAEGPQALPLLLQDHGNPVVFRNIWLAPLSDAETCAPACEKRRLRR